MFALIIKVGKLSKATKAFELFIVTKLPNLPQLLILSLSCTFQLFIAINSFHPLSCFAGTQTYSKDYRVQKAIDCQPENVTYPVKASNMKAVNANDTMYMSGTIEVLRELPMNVELEISLTRCNLDRSGCFFFDKFIFSRICEKMKTKTSIASRIVNGMHPAFQCPIAVGTYAMMNDSKFIIDVFKMLPLEDYLWRSRFVFHEKSGNKRIRPLGCMEYEVAIFSKPHRTKPNHQ